MAKNCSRCGEQLSFRNSFVWNKKPVCKECLKSLEQEHKEIVVPEPKKAEKYEQISNKWKVHDWVIFLMISVPLFLLLRPKSGGGLGLIVSFSIGALLGGFYHLTIHMFIKKIRPLLYKELICSVCTQVISEKTKRCPNCGSPF